jgi:hypothetical protein
MTVHILFENESWLPPLVRRSRRTGLEHEPHFVDGGVLDLAAPPPQGIFVNRMSPSAHNARPPGRASRT